MKRSLILCLLLAACNTPSQGYWGAEKLQFSEGGMRFTAYRKGNLIEVLRTSPEVLPTFPQVALRAVPGVERLTGCKAIWAEGDQALIEMGLSCGGAKAPKRKRRPKTLYCDIATGPARSGVTYGNMVCESG